MSVITSEEFWAEFHMRTKHMEEMLGTLLARSQGHREEDQSNSASSSRHQAGKDSIQIQNFRAKDPSHTSPSQVITLTLTLRKSSRKTTHKRIPTFTITLRKSTRTTTHQRNINPTTKQRPRTHHRPKERPTPTISTNTTTYQPIGTNTTQNPSQNPKKGHLLAKHESSAHTNTPKSSAMFTHRQATPSTTSKPSHPLPDFLNPALPIPQDHRPSATNQKDQTKKTTPTVETVPLSH
jgi:hypothetical protein